MKSAMAFSLRRNPILALHLFFRSFDKVLSESFFESFSCLIIERLQVQLISDQCCDRG